MPFAPATLTTPVASRPRAVFAILLLLAAGCLVAGVSAVFADPEFPELSGRVVDNANLLSAGERASITSDLAALEAQSTDQLVVVTLPSLQGYEIEEFGYKLGRFWGIGQKDKDNGALLIVAPNERKVRIEVGRGLEPLLTDALTRLIIENGILPRFRSGDFPGGIEAGVSDIIAVLTGDAEELKNRARSPRSDEYDLETIFAMMFWAFIIILIIWTHFQSIRHGANSTRPNRKTGPNGWSWGSGGSSGGGWSSGGGGFSGGGGGFGGGGSSGGW